MEDFSLILALTYSGLYLFTSTLESTSTVQVLMPIQHSPCSNLESSNVAVYIPRSGDQTTAEVWVCAQAGPSFQVLTPTDIVTVREEVKMPPIAQGKRRRIRHLQTMVVQERCCLFVGDRHRLDKWTVNSREFITTLDCYAACWAHKPSSSPSHHKQGRITSLATGNNTLYVGTGGGTILVVNPVDMTAVTRLEAYTTAVRCLSAIKMIKPFARMVSMDTTAIRSGSGSSVSTLNSTMSSSSYSSLDSVLASTSPHEPDTTTDDRSILMSFGVGYRGVVGSHKNYPESFILPHNHSSHACSCCTHFFIKAQPSPMTCYLLLWSIEGSGGNRYGGDSTDLSPSDNSGSSRSGGEGEGGGEIGDISPPHEKTDSKDDSNSSCRT